MERWHKSLGPPTTADLYLRRLRKFCEDNDITPQKLLELPDAEIKAIVLDYLAGKKGSYAATYLYAIKSWLEFNDRFINIKVKLTTAETEISKKEKVPTQEDLKRVLEIADLKAKVAIALIAFSAVRIEVLGNYHGTDGLRLGDIPDLVTDGKNVDIVSPAMIVVRSSLSKAKHQYFTFLNEQGCEYLEAYLRLRAMRGEKLEPSSPVIPSRKGGFLRSNSVSELIRKAIRTAGFSWRPYVLRHFFDTYMLMAEGAGIIPRDYRVFWMGHKGDIEHQYTTNKHKLPKDLVLDMRIRYERAAELFFEPKHEERSKAPTQKAVKPEELDEYLERGWEFVATLPDGRILLRR